jgi:uncharacterized phage protein gp47/JayE
MVVLTRDEFNLSMKNYFLANQNRITDMNTGSAIDTQFKAVATQLNQVMVKADGGFKRQFENIPYQVFDFDRRQEEFAFSTGTFTAPAPVTEQINIPSGSIVGTANGLLYLTESVVSILVGQDTSGVASVKAENPGAEYNVKVGDISILNSSIQGVSGFTNITAASGGKNVESNAEYYARFAIYILGLQGSNRYGVLTGALGVATIQSGYIKDHFPPESGIYNFTIYVDNGSGTTPQATLDEVKLVLSGDGTSQYKGRVVPGIIFRVLSAGLVNANITYEVEIDAVNTTPEEIEANATAAITNYINSTWVGMNIIHSVIIKILQNIQGVVSVQSVTINGSESNLIIQPSQVARVNTISQVVV